VQLRYHGRGAAHHRFFFEQYDLIRRGHLAQLKRIPVSPDEKAAGLEQLVAEWDALAVVNTLAGGDKTKWRHFWRLSWGEVNTLIEFENHQAHYRYKLHKQQERSRK
jgi:hypothetical protein